jgi:hypothetical protein
MASPAPKTIHGTSTIGSIPVIRLAPAADTFTITTPGDHVGPVKLSW